MRLFIGIALPEDIRFQLSLLCSGLPNVRWVPPENFHVTPRFTLSLGGVGHFGNGGNVRVIWAGVEKSPALRHLHDKIESAVVRAGLPPDGQKFNPHITLARPKSVPPTSKLQEYLAYNNLFKTPQFEVTHFTLFQSFTGGEGSIYRAEHSYELSRG